MGAIFRREVKAYFTSPIGYIFIAAFFAYSGIMFSATSLNSGYARLDGVFSNLLVIIIVLIPILTMRTIAEEKRSKTDQCLLTAPVSLGGIVAGKFFAALTVYIIAASVTVIMAVVVSVYGAPDWNVIVGNIAALILVGAAYISIGIFCSSFTENQVVAAVLSFVLLLAVSFLSTIGDLVPVEWIRKACEKISFGERYLSFTSGIFDFSHVVFFISASVAFLFLTVRVLEKRRWG
ncbi:MAG: ABC transporter permease subunit [Ruminococcus sp.]|nr:ABC transporter permease subunit [Ruminococcus sp.]